MKKRLIMPALLCLLLSAAVLTAAAAKEPGTGEPVRVAVFIDGRYVSIETPSVIIDSTTYVPFGALSKAPGAESVTWDGTIATVNAPDLSIQAAVGDSYIVANGRYLFVPTVCRVLGGELIVPVRPLAEAFGANLAWDGNTSTVYLTTGGEPIIPGSVFYDGEDVLWMSRIISAEARGESFLGKIAVGNVVMNRVASPWHPDTVYGVIFDKRSGIQFTPAYSGAIYNKPSAECVIAAKLALDGADVVGNSLYFSSSHLGCWAARNRPLTATIGNHSFYA